MLLLGVMPNAPSSSTSRRSASSSDGSNRPSEATCCCKRSRSSRFTHCAEDSHSGAGESRPAAPRMSDARMRRVEQGRAGEHVSGGRLRCDIALCAALLAVQRGHLLEAVLMQRAQPVGQWEGAGWEGERERRPHTERGEARGSGESGGIDRERGWMVREDDGLVCHAGHVTAQSAREKRRQAQADRCHTAEQRSQAAGPHGRRRAVAEDEVRASTGEQRSRGTPRALQRGGVAAIHQRRSVVWWDMRRSRLHWDGQRPSRGRGLSRIFCISKSLNTPE